MANPKVSVYFVVTVVMQELLFSQNNVIFGRKNSAFGRKKYEKFRLYEVSKKKLEISSFLTVLTLKV